VQMTVRVAFFLRARGRRLVVGAHGASLGASGGSRQASPEMHPATFRPGSLATLRDWAEGSPANKQV